MTIGERIRELRKNILHLGQDAFSEKIGITGGGMSLLELGKRNPTEQVLKSICREYNVNYLWLTTGEGEPLNDLPDTLIDELAIEYELTEEEKNLVKDFLSLTSEERKSVMKWLRPGN